MALLSLVMSVTSIPKSLSYAPVLLRRPSMTGTTLLLLKQDWVGVSLTIPAVAFLEEALP